MSEGRRLFSDVHCPCGWMCVWSWTFKMAHGSVQLYGDELCWRRGPRCLRLSWKMDECRLALCLAGRHCTVAVGRALQSRRVTRRRCRRRRSDACVGAGSVGGWLGVGASTVRDVAKPGRGGSEVCGRDGGAPGDAAAAGRGRGCRHRRDEIISFCRRRRRRRVCLNDANVDDVILSSSLARSRRPATALPCSAGLYQVLHRSEHSSLLLKPHLCAVYCRLLM